MSLDTETTGLRPYHGDKLFSVIIATSDRDSFYFNFKDYPALPPGNLLLYTHLLGLGQLFSDADKKWYLHNALFDLSMLAVEGLELAGTVHCTQVAARVVFNDHFKYDLASCAERIGYEKDDTVERYIEEHRLWTYTSADKPGQREKLKHYDRVPFELIVPYGERDATITFALGQSQEKALEKIDEDPSNSKLPPMRNILKNERRLSHTIYRMERLGVRIDRPYCVRAACYESDRAQKAVSLFKKETGKDFLASGKLFSVIFESEKDKWVYTEKGNPSFESDVLKTFENPAAKAILEYRDAKSRSDFYKGFLWHADRDDVIHPHFNPGGAATGRFTSSGPNFQNLTAEEGEELEEEFVVRRAIIPRPGYIFIMPDYDQMEYRMMFDQACRLWGHETNLVKKIKYEGLDPHQATADLVTGMGRMVLTRGKAKNGNFAELYGSGLDTLAATIKGTRSEALALKSALREAAPEVRNYVDYVTGVARSQCVVRNWAGRRNYCQDKNLAYKFTNYVIQGGCADVNKMALNQIDEYLRGRRSRLVLTIHDENPLEVHESELGNVPLRVKQIMESIYPHKYLPLTCGIEWSDKSLGDKKKGYP